MAHAEDVLFPYLNQWLISGRKDVGLQQRIVTMRDSGENPVPDGLGNPGGSQNWYVLQAGSNAVIRGVSQGGSATAEELNLIARLEAERDSIGLWGTEFLSLIYARFIITGWAAVYLNTNNQKLKDLIVHNLASYFWWAKEFGLQRSVHGMIGQRSTGHDFATNGLPELHFIMRYFLEGRPDGYKKQLPWKKYFVDEGWLVASLKGGKMYELMKDVFHEVVDPEFKPIYGRVKVTMIKSNKKKANTHFMDKGVHSSTPPMMAYMGGQHNQYLPVNSAVRWRNNDPCKVEWSMGGGMVYITYYGAYEHLDGGSDNHFTWSVEGDEQIRIITMLGDSGWKPLKSFSESVPIDPYVPVPSAPPKKKRPWWKFW